MRAAGLNIPDSAFIIIINRRSGIKDSALLLGNGVNAQHPTQPSLIYPAMPCPAALVHSSTTSRGCSAR